MKIFIHHNNGSINKTEKQTTLCLKKLHPFYFCDNFVGREQMLIIFGKKCSQGNW